jgi:hypothetical protein
MSFNLFPRFSLVSLCIGFVLTVGLPVTWAKGKSARVTEAKASAAGNKNAAPSETEEENVELSKSMDSDFGKIDLKIEEKPRPEPALKPFWLSVRVACKSGKKFSKRFDVCDSDLAMTVENGLLKTSYFGGDPQATDDDSQEDDLVCDEDNAIPIEIDLNKECAASAAAPKKAKQVK